MRKELLKGLNEEQIEKFQKANSFEELLGLAKEEGIELNDEQLEAISGGGCLDSESPEVKFHGPHCLRCGSTNVEVIQYQNQIGGTETQYTCWTCWHKWWD